MNAPICRLLGHRWQVVMHGSQYFPGMRFYTRSCRRCGCEQS